MRLNHGLPNDDKVLLTAIGRMAKIAIEGRYPALRDALEHATEQLGSSPSFWRAAAILFTAGGEAEQAERYLRKTLLVDPSNLAGWMDFENYMAFSGHDGSGCKSQEHERRPSIGILLRRILGHGVESREAFIAAINRAASAGQFGFTHLLNCVFLERFHQVDWRFAPDHQDSRQIFNETSIRFRLQKRSDGLAAQFFLGAEPGMFDWILGFEPGSTFVDIGGSNGVWSIFAAAVGGTNCHIFESNQVRGEQLEQNLRQNELVGKVTVHRVGLADQDGEITLEEPTTDGKREALGLGPQLQRLIRAAIPGRTETELEYLLRALLLTEKPTTIARRRPVRRLSDLINDGSVPEPTYIKIDIDGNALPILHDIEPVLAGGALRGLMIEIYKDSDYRADVLAYLARYGFRPFTFGRPKNVFFKL